MNNTEKFIAEVLTPQFELSNEIIDKKDVRIFFNGDKQGKITDLVVIKFPKNSNRRSLYNKSPYKIGNCLPGWDKWDPVLIILHLWVRYEFSNKDYEFKAIKELIKIKELRNSIAGFLTAYLK